MADTDPTAPTGWKARYGDLVLSIGTKLAIALLGALAAWLGLAPKTVEKIVTIEKTVNVGPPSQLPPMGWVDDRDEVAKIAAQMPIKAFRDTPAMAAMGDAPDHAFLWEQAKKVRGGHIPARNQGSVGSCVSFGSACAIEYMECVQLVAEGGQGKSHDVAQEPIYGGSRVQIGGGVLRGEDGSTGAWAAQWVSKYGVVIRGVHDSYDLTTYSESVCRKMGDDGCPASLVVVAKKHPVKSVTLVRSTDEARKALANGYPITVASNVGFGSRGPYKRDADGFLRASGTWAHQMCFIGYRSDRPGFYCMNSWGADWVGGPTGPGDPPAGGFWVAESTVARMLSQGDSWAYSGLVGFQPQKLDWAAAPARRPVHLALTSHPFGDVQCDRFALSP